VKTLIISAIITVLVLMWSREVFADTPLSECTTAKIQALELWHKSEQERVQCLDKIQKLSAAVTAYVYYAEKKIKRQRRKIRKLKRGSDGKQ